MCNSIGDEWKAISELSLQRLRDSCCKMFPNEMSQVDTEPIWRDLLKSQEGKKISIFERQIVNFLSMKQMPFVRSFVPNRILNLSSKVAADVEAEAWVSSKKCFKVFLSCIKVLLWEFFSRLVKVVPSFFKTENEKSS